MAIVATATATAVSLIAAVGGGQAGRWVALAVLIIMMAAAAVTGSRALIPSATAARLAMAAHDSEMVQATAAALAASATVGLAVTVAWA